MSIQNKKLIESFYIENHIFKQLKIFKIKQKDIIEVLFINGCFVFDNGHNISTIKAVNTNSKNIYCFDFNDLKVLQNIGDDAEVQFYDDDTTAIISLKSELILRNIPTPKIDNIDQYKFLDAEYKINISNILQVAANFTDNTTTALNGIGIICKDGEIKIASCDRISLFFFKDKIDYPKPFKCNLLFDFNIENSFFAKHEHNYYLVSNNINYQLKQFHLEFPFAFLDKKLSNLAEQKENFHVFHWNKDEVLSFISQCYDSYIEIEFFENKCILKNIVSNETRIKTKKEIRIHWVKNKLEGEKISISKKLLSRIEKFSTSSKLFLSNSKKELLLKDGKKYYTMMLDVLN